jgi:hypothetical protein
LVETVTTGRGATPKEGAMRETFEDRFRRARRYLTTMEIIQLCRTVSPSKRLSEQRRKGNLQERPSLSHPGLKEYRYRKAAA